MGGAAVFPGGAVAPEDLDGMAASAIAVLQNPALHARIAQAARRRVADPFCVDRVVPMYEKCYLSVLD